MIHDDDHILDDDDDDNSSDNGSVFTLENKIKGQHKRGSDLDATKATKTPTKKARREIVRQKGKEGDTVGAEGTRQSPRSGLNKKN